MENINQLLSTLEVMESQITEIKKNLLKKTPPQITPAVGFAKAELDRLLGSDDWPIAVPAIALCNSEEDKVGRAQEILEIMRGMAVITENKMCLDYGCGDGHLVKAMAEKAKFSIGYDPANTTTNLVEVTANAPYDVVVLYDVLDHVENENPVEVLKKIKELIHKDSMIFIRFHPWCGKHGTHLYRQINKAFIQLFYTLDELLAMGYKPMPTIEIAYPVRTYKQWIQEAGLKLLRSTIERSSIPPIFYQQPFVEKIKAIWGDPYSIQMEIEFADTVIGL